jgi:hypothetical protein
MPTISFKLADSRFCDGCPLINTSPPYGDPDDCNLGFDWEEDCRINYNDGTYESRGTSKRLKRPQACIDKHGE